MNIVEMRIWKIRDLAIGTAVYVAALVTGIVATGKWQAAAVSVLCGLAVLTLLHDPKGSATLRGLWNWNELLQTFSNEGEPDLFWATVWRLAFWGSFPILQIIVFALAWLQRSRQRAAWREATAAAVAEFERTMATWHNTALDADGADNTPHKSPL